MAVLPPMAASTMASKVVGTWMKGSPRMKMEARKPATSPTTPPPRAMTGVRRWAPRARSSRARRWTTAQVLARSPGGVVRSTGARPAAVRESSTAAPWRRATRRSEITTTRGGNRKGLSRGPSR